MMARSTGSTTRPNTLMQLSRSSVRQHHLATHGRTIHYIHDILLLGGAVLVMVVICSLEGWMR
jgi:hypothetical protein